MKLLRNILVFILATTGFFVFLTETLNIFGVDTLSFKLGFSHFFYGDAFKNSESFLSGEDVVGVDVFNSSKIEQAKSIIKREYYQFNQKSKKEIEDGVLESIVQSLGDKHSTYFNQKDAQEFKEVLRGDFEGIGAVIDRHTKGIVIRKVFDTSPAKKSGLQDGDIILKVGNESMVGVSTEEAVKKIRGPKGSKVLIEYLHGLNEVKTVEITRGTIMIPSVEGKILSGSTIGYVEVLFFGDNTTNEFTNELINLSKSGATSLILDFRGNGGGYLDTAVDLLSYFFKENTLVVRTRQNNPKQTEELKTHKTPKLFREDLPVVMLINSLSASATEIVAGAFQDYGRAIILGEKSYGKGSVQEPFILDDGSILKITIGRWYTPKDQNIDKNGITPDVTVPIFETDYIEKNDRQLSAAKEIIGLLSLSGSSVQSVIDEAKTKDFIK
ncbi:MAG: S41 family peptidase [Candidatus Altimarinota bacterium]